jgi:hypothetical protein
MPDLDAVHLGKGAHRNRQDGVCLLEAVAWYAGRDHSDAPPCVSPVLRAFGTNLNDVLPDDRRQTLRPLIPILVGTAGDGHDKTRSYMALDWLIRTYTPTWLDLAGLTAEATALRDLRRIVDLVAAQQAGPVVRVARAAARDAAEDAAGDAASAAARAAASAASAAARAAAWDAAGAAARDAAEAAAEAAAWAAAWAAAGDAAGDAAWAAAEAAAWAAAWDAAGAAARDALQPTVDVLQLSAIELYTRMIRPEVES